jgi:hypothetical protein
LVHIKGTKAPEGAVKGARVEGLVLLSMKLKDMKDLLRKEAYYF